MKYKQIISTINKKKQNFQEFYEDLLLLEREVNHCESLVKAQVLYILGVDFLFYQDINKALEYQYSSLDLLINLIYTTREIEVVHFTIQKVIIEISKIFKNPKGDQIIKSFYFNIENEIASCKLKKLIRDFQEVKRIFKDNNEIFIYLLQENPKDCLDFMTTDKQIDLLIDKLKIDFDFEIMQKLKMHKQNDFKIREGKEARETQETKGNHGNINNHNHNLKLLIFFLIYDKDHFYDYLSQLRSFIITNPSLIPDLLTSCLSLSKVDILHEIVNLLPEEIKKNIKIVYSDIYKIFSDEMVLDDLIDLEQVTHFWFTTGQYSKILKIEEKVCKKLKFICKNRNENEEGDYSGYKEDIDNGEYDLDDYDDYDHGEYDFDDLDKIGATWNLENNYVLEKIKFNLKIGKYEKIKEMTREVKDLEILIKILNVIKEKMENKKIKKDVVSLPNKKIHNQENGKISGHKKIGKDVVSLPNINNNQVNIKNYDLNNPIKISILLKDILLDCLNRKGILFHALKVFISYLHLQDLDFGVFERLRILNGLKIEGLSEADKIWLQKVVYNNLVDVYNEEGDYNVNDSINLLLNLPLTQDSFIISILMSSKINITKIYDIYSLYSQPSPFISALFYGVFLKSDPLKAKDILLKIEFDTKSLVYLLGLEEVDPRIVIESHYKRLLTPIHLENIVMRLRLKGTLFLYEYLKSIIVIGIQKYLTEESKIVIKGSLKIVEKLKSSEMILFFTEIIEG
jgi:hypothetical protein